MNGRRNIEEVLDEKDAEDFVSESVFSGSKRVFARNEIIHTDNFSFDDKKKNQKLAHDNQDHTLKIWTAIFLVVLLYLQSLAIFLLVFYQGFKFRGFDLDKYIFYILITGVLTESYFLVRIIVEHLFPKKDDKDEKFYEPLLESLISKIKSE